MSVLADQLHRSMSGVPAGCTCPMTVDETLNRHLGGSDDLCRVHDAAQIEKRRLDEIRDIAQERVDIMRNVVARQDAAEAPKCSCRTAKDALAAAFAGAALLDCALHAIPSEQSIGIGDDAALLASLETKLGFTTTVTEL